MIGIAVRALLMCSPLIAAAATDMFLKLPGIEGESLDNAHAQEIDVLGWSWGFNKTASNTVRMNDLQVTKYVDRATPALMLACSRGTTLSNALLTCRRGGSAPLEFIKVELSNVSVTGINEGGSAGEDRFQEFMSLGFGRIKFEYFYMDGATIRKELFSSDPNVTDMDGDGMPDAFEQTYGLNPQQNDAAADKDGDGMSNYDEYRAGTSPSDRNSIFKCTLIYATGSPSAVLRWNSVSGRRYQAHYTTNAGGALLPLGAQVLASGATTEINVPIDLARRFYRVQVLPVN
ncbi:MAG TPA: type VI secretion system tube protein Hcp [Verrucomicrobiae bacterium]|nr:type VI secretion system tube protein Hcp [Verrucomicrobiae bacterium]